MSDKQVPSEGVVDAISVGLKAMMDNLDWTHAEALCQPVAAYFQRLLDDPNGIMIWPTDECDLEICVHIDDEGDEPYMARTVSLLKELMASSERELVIESLEAILAKLKELP